MSEDQDTAATTASSATVLALVASDTAHKRKLERVLAQETGLSLRVRLCGGCKDLRQAHSEERISLLAYWPRRARVAGEAVRDEIAGWAEPPVLLLVSERIEAQHYHVASNLDARGVIDLSDPARAAFVIKRELGYVRLLERFNRVYRQLTDQYVVDESTIATAPEDARDRATAHTIDRALQNDALDLVFQPIVGLKDDAHEIYEVFTRIHGDERAMEPAEFLPVAARYGLMPAIDRWVVRAAAKRYRRERERRGSHDRRFLSFFINISAPTLVERPSINRILLLLAAAEPAPGAFVLELEKGSILSRLKLAKSLNHLLKKRQLAFAIDEYDQDDARLNYTRHVSVDYVKLSREAIEGIDKNATKRESVRQLIQSAHDAGFQVIATQIERMAELQPLYEAGVDYVQGYLLAEPSPSIEQPVTTEANFG